MNSSFGGRPDRNIGRVNQPSRREQTSGKVERELTPERLEKAYALALKLLEDPTIKMSSFKGHYPDKELRADEEYVEKCEGRFAETDAREAHSADARKLAKVFEAILFEGVKHHGWLGKTTSPRVTSPYDDYSNGVDMIAEQPAPEQLGPEYLALAVDAVYSPSNTEVKIEKILQWVRSGKLAEVKYYQSDITGKLGNLDNIPLIALGVEKKTTLKLAEMWLSVHEGTIDQKEFARSPIRGVLMHEALVQLSAYEQYARTCNKPKVADAYHRSLLFVKRAMEAAKEENIPVDYTKSTDRVHMAIKDGVKKLAPSYKKAA